MIFFVQSQREIVLKLTNQRTTKEDQEKPIISEKKVYIIDQADLDKRGTELFTKNIRRTARICDNYIGWNK